MNEHLPFLNQESTALFELLMALDVTGMLWLDRNGNILYASEAFADRLGYTVKFLKKRQIFDLEMGLTLLDYKKRWNRLDTERQLQVELSLTDNSGKPVSLNCSGYMLDSTTPGISCWQVETEAANQYKAAAAESFVKRKNAAAWQWDIVSGHFHTEPYFDELIGVTRQDESAQKQNILNALKNVMPHSAFQELLQQIKSLQKTKQWFTLTFLLQNEKAETSAPPKLQLYAEPVVEKEIVSKIRGLLMPASNTGGSFDHLAREALHRSDAMICWIQPDCTISYANRALCQRLGFSKAELQGGMEITDIDAENTSEQWEEIWGQASELRTIELESTLKTKSERIFPAAFYLNYLDIEGEKLISLSARDITDRRRKEADLRKALLEVNALSEQLEAENVYLKGEVSADYNFENIITQSPDYKKLLKKLEQVATSEATVLIEGETGTGKELLAHAIHNLSPRKKQSMVRVNCAALSEELILSELFGHEKGAFTGAADRKIGRFELADKGTLFLDEVGEVSAETQAKLLRVIQEGEFERLGGVETLNVDVRLIAATNRNLREMVQQNQFREDLYYRLSVFPLRNLPLRERKEDIPLLVRHFMEKFAQKNGKNITQIRSKDMKKLQAYDFPGNIRELMNIVEQAVILSQGNTLDFSYWNPTRSPSNNKKDGQEFLSLEEIQRQHILDALEKTHWRVTGPQGAARLLGMKGQTLFSKMKKLGIKRE